MEEVRCLRISTATLAAPTSKAAGHMAVALSTPPTSKAAGYMAAASMTPYPTFGSSSDDGARPRLPDELDITNTPVVVAPVPRCKMERLKGLRFR